MKKFFGVLNVFVHIIWGLIIVGLFLTLRKNDVFANAMINLHTHFGGTPITVEYFYVYMTDILCFTSIIMAVISLGVWITYGILDRREYNRIMHGEILKTRKAKKEARIAMKNSKAAMKSSVVVLAGGQAAAAIKKEAKLQAQNAKKAKKLMAKAARSQKLEEMKNARQIRSEERLHNRSVKLETKIQKKAAKRIEAEKKAEMKAAEKAMKERLIQEEIAKMKAAKAAAEAPIVKSEPVVEQVKPVVQEVPEVKPVVQPKETPVVTNTQPVSNQSSNSQLDDIFRQAMARKGRR